METKLKKYQEIDKYGITPQFKMLKQRYIGVVKNYTSAHYHDHIEILYCTDGKFDVWLNYKYYHIEKGDLIIINAEEVHSVDGRSDGANGLMVLGFAPEIIYDSSQSLFEIKYILPFLTDRNPPQKVFKCSEIGSAIPELLKQSFKEYEKKEYGYELAIRANICNLFLWVLRHWSESGAITPDLDAESQDMMQKLRKALKYMSQNFSGDLTAEQMANICGLSYSYFSRCFKKLLKRSFSDYLNYLRVSEAVKLLMSTELNITEIAMQVGFSTSSYFIQQFKKFKGMSPKQFKKKFFV